MMHPIVTHWSGDGMRQFKAASNIVEHSFKVLDSKGVLWPPGLYRLDPEALMAGTGLAHGRPTVYFSVMSIRLSPDQQAWLEAQVAAGQFSSVDAAVAVAVADLMAISDDDLAWAKPYVDEAHAAAARGEVISLDDAVTDIDTHIAALKR